MAKLTRDQLEKFNGKCKNGFSLDLFFFCTWGEKRCKKIVKEVGEMVTRKTVKILQELTEGYTDEKLVDMIKMLIAA